MVDLAPLLIKPASEGYPTDYLLARLRGRRQRLGGAPAGPSHLRAGERTMPASEAWHTMRAEFRWVHHQMNGEVRQTFIPLFLWFEMRTIILCLRFRRGNDRADTAGLLADSLLSAPARRVLTADSPAPAMVDALASLLVPVAGAYRTIGSIFREQGGRKLEQRLVSLYLERVAGLPLHSTLREFFRGVIDLHNLVTVGKQVRWRLTEPEAFISGGSIPLEHLVKAAGEENPAAFMRLLHALPGMALPTTPTKNPEPHLLNWLTRRIRRSCRDPLDVGVVLYYLWSCFVEARNRSLLHHGEGVEPTVLEAELIG